MMLFGQLLNVKMTSMAGDSKKQSTAIPLGAVHKIRLQEGVVGGQKNCLFVNFYTIENVNGVG